MYLSRSRDSWAAAGASDALFGGGTDTENIPTFELDMTDAMALPEFLVAIKLFPSKSEARRMIAQGAIQINGNKITDWQATVAPADEIMVQKGKKTFLRVVKRG